MFTVVQIYQGKCAGYSESCLIQIMGLYISGLLVEKGLLWSTVSNAALGSNMTGTYKCQLSEDMRISLVTFTRPFSVLWVLKSHGSTKLATSNLSVSVVRGQKKLLRIIIWNKKKKKNTHRCCHLYKFMPLFASCSVLWTKLDQADVSLYVIQPNQLYTQLKTGE